MTRSGGVEASGSTTPASSASSAQLDHDIEKSAENSGASTPTNNEKTTADSGKAAKAVLSSYSTDALEQSDKTGFGKPIMIEWDPNDPRHPFNWSLRLRWYVAIIAFLFNSSTAMNATGYNTGQDLGAEDLNTTSEVWLTGTTAYITPVAITPLILAPLSEIYGRRPLYLVALFFYTAMFIPQALAPNMAAILASRVFQGVAGCVGNTMVAGSLSDIFPKEKRAIPMGLFVLVVFMSQAIGSTASAWTVYTIGWRYMFWWQFAIAAVSFVILLFTMPETRSSVILSRRARELTLQTAKLHRTEEDEDRESFFVLASRNLSRPIIFLTTEPIVTFLALWIGFLWGVVFITLQGVSDTFDAYGWSSPLKSTVLLTIGVGAVLGFLSNLHQTHLYTRAWKRSGNKSPAPEARLYWSMPAALMTVGGLFWYGWGGREEIHPVVPILGLIVFSWGTYIIYLATLNYIADAYEKYASSGVACQALIRNLFGATFGLFAHGMYNNLSPPIASTVLACIAAFLGTAPFILFFFGDKLRKHSRIYQRLRREEEEKGRVY